MTEKSYLLFGTKIYNHTTKEIGLLICTWVNAFSDGKMDFATCVDKRGKRYNTPLENIKVIHEADET
ncbi:unknown [Fusobacterium sp. CAG:439]|nr:unknown [Fusobacterium sp. CAG:439]